MSVTLIEAKRMPGGFSHFRRASGVRTKDFQKGGYEQDEGLRGSQGLNNGGSAEGLGWICRIYR